MIAYPMFFTHILQKGEKEKASGFSRSEDTLLAWEGNKCSAPMPQLLRRSRQRHIVPVKLLLSLVLDPVTFSVPFLQGIGK